MLDFVQLRDIFTAQSFKQREQLQKKQFET
jgi:hypothetical protein